MERKKKRKIEKDYTVLYTAYLCALCIQIQYLDTYINIVGMSILENLKMESEI